MCTLWHSYVNPYTPSVVISSSHETWYHLLNPARDGPVAHYLFALNTLGTLLAIRDQIFQTLLKTTPETFALPLALDGGQ